MSPTLLTMLQMQRFECFFHCLMGGKAGPFVMTSLRAEVGLGQIRLGLMQPVSRTIHLSILNLIRNESALRSTSESSALPVYHL